MVEVAEGIVAEALVPLEAEGTVVAERMQVSVVVMPANAAEMVEMPVLRLRAQPRQPRQQVQ